MCREAVFDEQKAREFFLRARAKSNGESAYSDEKQLISQTNRLAEIDKLIQAAFEDRVLKNLPESVFKSLCEKYQSERCAIEEEVAKLQNRLNSGNKDEEDADEYISRLKSYGKCEELTREACLQLINFITVGEKDKDGGRKIHIYYQLKNF